ncbi:MAG: hypothetical protein K8F91_20880, partial [Candidatus Obscuribacterales bacterium]|nr:hypothetical protein [Candidatus Obscuribacterales bacterium]
MDENRIIVFTPSTPPLLLKRFTWRDFEQATAFPPSPRPEIQVDDKTIQTCRRAKKKLDWQRHWDKLKKQEEAQESTASKESSEAGSPKTELNRDRKKTRKPQPEKPKEKPREEKRDERSDDEDEPKRPSIDRSSPPR